MKLIEKFKVGDIVKWKKEYRRHAQLCIILEEGDYIPKYTSPFMGRAFNITTGKFIARWREDIFEKIK